MSNQWVKEPPATVADKCTTINQWVVEPTTVTDTTSKSTGGLKVTLKPLKKRKFDVTNFFSDSPEHTLKHLASAPLAILESPTKSKIATCNSSPGSPDLDLIDLIDPEKADKCRNNKKRKNEAIELAIAFATKAATKATSDVANDILNSV